MRHPTRQEMRTMEYVRVTPFLETDLAFIWTSFFSLFPLSPVRMRDWVRG